MEPGHGALKVVFVAGNEPAEQDPQLTLESRRRGRAPRHRRQRDLLRRRRHADARGWRKVAADTNGLYASIDQNAAAVDNVATPFDARLAALNDEFNATYIAFGGSGESGRANPVAQDGNAAAMSPAAAASRTVAKAGALYRSEWDLVDAVQSGKRSRTFRPPSYRPRCRRWSPKREAHVREPPSAARTCSVKSASSPPSAVATSLSRTATSDGAAEGLDAAIFEGIREVAATKGFSFASK